MSTLHAQPPTKAAVVFGHIKYWLWKVFVCVFLGTIYVSVIAEGARLLMPPLAQKVYKLAIPGFAALGQYQETRRLDLAIPFAFVIFLVASSCWELVLLVLLGKEESFDDSGWKVDNYKRLILILGAIFLFADRKSTRLNSSHSS